MVVALVGDGEVAGLATVPNQEGAADVVVLVKISGKKKNKCMTSKIKLNFTYS